MNDKKRKLSRFSFPDFLFIIIFVVSAIFLEVSSGSFISNFNRFGFTILASIQKGIHAVTSTVTGSITAIKDIAVLKKEYNELTVKLKDYEYMQRNNTEIKKENALLKEQLGLSTSIQYKNTAAQIIGRDIDNLYTGLTINKGAKHGIKKGQHVIGIQNGNVGIVGKIITVGLGTSVIMPIYDTKCNISSRIQNTRDIGLTTGTGFSNSPLKLQYIRKRIIDDINIGDVIVTSGENGNYLRDIPIGRISKIKVLDYDNSLDIELDTIIDFSRLEIVLVVDLETEKDFK